MTNIEDLIALLRCTQDKTDRKVYEFCGIMGYHGMKCDICRQNATRDAATAIETLLAEREAAIEELRGICWCCVYGKKWDKAPEWSKMTTCEHLKEQGVLACNGGKSKCQHWQWRGPTPPDQEQKEADNAD